MIKEKPIILIFDVHASHKSLEAIELPRKSGIVILTFPPHTTQKLQVLDIGIFGPFKNYMAQGMDLWVTNDPGVRITVYYLTAIIKDAFLRALTPNNIRRGFRKSGIAPFCPRAFDENDFVPSESLTEGKYAGE